MRTLKRLHKIGFSKLTSVEEAWSKLESQIELIGAEQIDVNNALNRILAEDITSEFDVPPFDRSAMDGYAIIAEDSFGASPQNPKKVKKVGKIEIGEVADLRVNKGEAIRISTGAAMPEGANAVVKIEDTEIENDIITLYNALVPYKNVAKHGEDIPANTKVLERGTELKAGHIALLASLGINKIQVRRKPRVSVFSTGDELLEPGQPLEKNKIYNSNTPMISSLVTIYGGKVSRSSTLKDDKDLIKETLIDSAKDSNIIIFTGGTSVGTQDYLPEVLEENGTVVTHGIAMRPGSPLLIGYYKGALVFCLPGTPVAAYVCFVKFAGRALRKMMGCMKIDPRVELIAKMNNDVPVSSMGYLHHLRVKLEKRENIFYALPVKLKGSGIITSLTESDGIVEIPPHQEGLKKEDEVSVMLLPK
ncbi:MAG: molybdopterin molybdenumtransferase MoeA [Candidatus Lokiarchaeota archaeon]|nr:molybdopterin molybdenumtransferase MoeA [Candidatus Lokiarchaeota archaeon]MBD3338893.1 molybdopterin molybdenumtransferase MoeA [Candidatus Lokiarchaeota archaeon]